MTLAERCDEIVRLIDATLAEFTASDSGDAAVDDQSRTGAARPATYVGTADPRPGHGWLTGPRRSR